MRNRELPTTSIWIIEDFRQGLRGWGQLVSFFNGHLISELSLTLSTGDDDIVLEDKDTTIATTDVTEEDDQDLYFQNEEDTSLAVLFDIDRIFSEDSDVEEFDGF